MLYDRRAVSELRLCDRRAVSELRLCDRRAVSQLNCTWLNLGMCLYLIISSNQRIIRIRPGPLCSGKYDLHPVVDDIKHALTSAVH